MARSAYLISFLVVSILPLLSFSDVQADGSAVALLQTSLELSSGRARTEALRRQKVDDDCDGSDPNCVPLMANARDPPAGEATTLGDMPQSHLGAEALRAAAVGDLMAKKMEAMRAAAVGDLMAKKLEAMGGEAAKQMEAAEAAAAQPVAGAPEPEQEVAAAAAAAAAAGTEAAEAAAAQPVAGAPEPEQEVATAAAAAAAGTEEASTTGAIADEATSQPQGGHLVAPHCTPTCKWTCHQPTCEEECSPVCRAPVCETRCGQADLAGCSMACDEPRCSVLCPASIKELPKRPCSTHCSEAMCNLRCDGRPQPCRHVCEPPQCEWKCKAPTSCPKPQCKMICQNPSSCSGHSTMEKLPPLEPGEISVQAFQAPPGAMQVRAGRTVHSVAHPTIRVPVRSLTQAEAGAEPVAREWHQDLPLRPAVGPRP